MLGFNALGYFALGQVTPAPSTFAAGLYNDADVFTVTNTLSINYVQHAGVISIDFCIRPAVVSQSELESSGFKDSDAVYPSSLEGMPGTVLVPSHLPAVDIVYASSLARGSVVLVPPRYIDTDNLLSPKFTRYLTVSALYVDQDILIPPFMAQRRAFVRSGVGVIKGRIDTVALIGDRDAA